MPIKKWMRRSFHRQRRASWTVGVPPRKRQVSDFQLGRRNTTAAETLPHCFATPPSTHTPSTPKSASSLTDIDEAGPKEIKFKFPYKRRATIGGPLVMSKSRSSPGVPSMLSPVPNGTPNGHVRTRHLSTGSSNQSDDPDISVADITTTSNFFDFDENADDLYLAPPEEYIHNMRIREKIRGSLRKDSITAQPFTPVNVETIGGAYIEEEGSGGNGGLKTHSRQGSKVSVLSSIPESVKSGHSSSKSLPLTTGSARLTPPGTPGSREILARDDRIAQLERELEELKAARWKPPPITDTINRILLGQSYCLEWYKSMDQKRALLDAALDTFDGNCITTVLLFIRKTLNHQILMMMVKTRPSAVSHYCSFLKQLHAWKELTTVYQTLGDYESLGYLKLRECEDVEDADQRLKQLQACQSMFSTTPTLKKNVQYVEEYVKLVKKQKQIVATETKGNAHIKIPVMFTPVTTTLLYCCRQHFNSPPHHTCNPEALREMFKISEKQYFQVCLLAFTLRQNWTAIENLLTTKGVFGIGKKKKSPIGFERVVRTLGNPKLSRRPPPDVLRKYLLAVDDLESRLSLATYTMFYDVGIEASFLGRRKIWIPYVEQFGRNSISEVYRLLHVLTVTHTNWKTLKQMRDRERLRSYLNQIPLRKQGEYRGKIRALLDNSQIKWKNH